MLLDLFFYHMIYFTNLDRSGKLQNHRAGGLTLLAQPLLLAHLSEQQVAGRVLLHKVWRTDAIQFTSISLPEIS